MKILDSKHPITEGAIGEHVFRIPPLEVLMALQGNTTRAHFAKTVETFARFIRCQTTNVVFCGRDAAGCCMPVTF